MNTGREFVMQPVEYGKTKKRRFWPWILGGSLLMILALCGGSMALLGLGGTTGAVIDGLASASPEPSPKSSGQAGTGAKAKATPPKAKATPQPLVGEGMWEVGVTVKAGRYKTSGAEDRNIPLCYWDLRTGTADKTIVLGTQGVLDSPTAPGYVTLKKGLYFKTTGCNPWELIGVK